MTRYNYRDCNEFKTTGGLSQLEQPDRGIEFRFGPGSATLSEVIRWTQVAYSMLIAASDFSSVEHLDEKPHTQTIEALKESISKECARYLAEFSI